MKASLFAGQDAIAVFNFDVNNLKEMNDNHGYEAGDKLLKKAADSLHAVEESDIMAFRVGGDEFMLVGLHLDREAAEALKRRWEEALERLNAQDDDVNCVMACGMVCGKSGYDLDELLAEADERMYQDKVAKKNGALPR